MFCGTYNVNGKAPEEDVTPWLCSLRGSDGALPDVMAVGCVGGCAVRVRRVRWFGESHRAHLPLTPWHRNSFQEIVDLNAANVVVGAATEKRAAKWEATINATLARAVGHGDDAFEVVRRACAPCATLQGRCASRVCARVHGCDPTHPALRCS